jgi:hypothetical protein
MRQLWGMLTVSPGGSRDRVAKGCARVGCGRHRVSEGALYDPNDAQRAICPDCLLRVVSVRTVCRCPATALSAPPSAQALGPAGIAVEAFH